MTERDRTQVCIKAIAHSHGSLSHQDARDHGDIPLSSSTSYSSTVSEDEDSEEEEESTTSGETEDVHLLHGGTASKDQLDGLLTVELETVELTAAGKLLGRARVDAALAAARAPDSPTSAVPAALGYGESRLTAHSPPSCALGRT
jgi:hypothetical protein